jgi:hypothetical protein
VTLLRSQDFDETFIEMLEWVQECQLKLFLPVKNLSEMYRISYSLQKGSMSEAQATGVDKADVNWMNIWKVEWAKGQQPKFHIPSCQESVRDV